MADQTATSTAPAPARLTHLWERPQAGLWRLPWQFRRLMPGAAACLAAAVVGYEAASNPLAGPAHIAAILRVLIIMTFVGAGLYAQTSKLQERMGRLLIGAGFFAAVWLLNGSSHRAAFSIGVLASGFFPLVMSFLMLASPSGRLATSTEKRFLVGVGGAAGVVWVLSLLISPQPLVHTPLLRCLPHCPRQIITLGTGSGPVIQVMKVLLWMLWMILTLGTAWLMWRRTRAASGPVRRAAIPVVAAACAMALIWLGFALSRLAGSPLATTFGAAYIEVAIVIPLAILSGLMAERLLLGRALADFVTGVAEVPKDDPEALMATFLRDPSVRIGYWRSGWQHWVDRSGNVIDTESLDPTQTVSWVQRGHVPLAMVIHDSETADQDRYVQAAGAAALLVLERTQLEADLKASTRELAASRVRLVESADAERQRIERDLHDSVQQDLIALRLKLDMAAEATREEPLRGERMFQAVGRQLDELLETLRALARGIYPSLLSERGVVEALKSAGRRAPIAVSVDGRGVGRYREELEVAVYFCCLEALQNAIKHAGRDAVVSIRMRDRNSRLVFDVSDDGVGFDPRAVADRHGIVNMHDRTEAVGGTLAVISEEGSGTRVRGSIPLQAEEYEDPDRGLMLMESLHRQYVP
jgi:signal transduction histidine kinase